jgi:hypothetical protein
MYTEDVATAIEWGKKCPVCGKLFKIGDKCAIVKINDDTFPNTLIHNDGVCNRDVTPEEACNFIEKKYQMWSTLSGIWHVSVPEDGI